MRFALFFSVFCLLAPAAVAKTTAGDCADCGVKKGAASMKTEFIDKVARHLQGIPGSAPSDRRTAGIYLGRKMEPMQPGYPWNSVGRFFIPEVKNGRATGRMDFCTATRISACHLLTAKHCVVKPDGGLEENLTYVPPFRKDFFTVEKGKILAPDGDHEKDRGLDWAVVKLEEPTKESKDGSDAKKEEFLCVSRREGTELVGKTFSSAGYNKDFSANAGVAYVDQKSEVIKTDKGWFSGNPNFIHLRANAGFGTSGGPILELGADGKACVVGVITAGATDQYGNAKVLLNADETEVLTQGVAAAAFIEPAKKFIAENPCKNP